MFPLSMCISVFRLKQSLYTPIYIIDYIFKFISIDKNIYLLDRIFIINDTLSYVMK